MGWFGQEHTSTLNFSTQDQPHLQPTSPPKYHNTNSDLSTIAANDDSFREVSPEKSSKIKWVFLGGCFIHLGVLILCVTVGKSAAIWESFNICTNAISAILALFIFVTWRRKFNSNVYLQEELFRATMTSPIILTGTSLGLLIIASARHFSNSKSGCIKSHLGCLPYLPRCTFAIYLVLAIYWAVAAWLVGTKLVPVSGQAFVDINEIMRTNDYTGETKRFNKLRQLVVKEPVYFLWFSTAAFIAWTFAVLSFEGDGLMFTTAELAQNLFLWLAISLRARSGKLSYIIFGGVGLITLLAVILTGFSLPYRSLNKGVGFLFGSVLIALEVLSLGVFYLHAQEIGYKEKLRVEKTKQLFFCRNFRSQKSEVDVFVAAVERN